MKAAASWAAIPETHGDFAAEYEALVGGCAQVDLAGGVLDVTGEDAASFLHGQLSADVTALPVKHAVRTLALTPQGRLVGVGYLLRLGEEDFRLLLPREQVVPVADALDRFRIRVRVETRPRVEAGVWRITGPGAADAGIVSAADLPADGAACSTVGSQVVVRAEGDPFGGYFVVSESGDLAVTGATPVGRRAVDARRVELCAPVFGVDFDTRTIPHDAGLVPDAVSLDKGCYTGQELIERIHSRGHANRLPRSVRLGTDDVPEPGTEVVADGRTVGVLTTTAFCPGLGTAGGLGLLRVEVAPGDAVSVADVEGTVLP